MFDHCLQTGDRPTRTTTNRRGRQLHRLSGGHTCPKTTPTDNVLLVSRLSPNTTAPVPLSSQVERSSWQRLCFRQLEQCNTGGPCHRSTAWLIQFSRTTTTRSAISIQTLLSESSTQTIPAQPHLPQHLEPLKSQHPPQLSSATQSRNYLHCHPRFLSSAASNRSTMIPSGTLCKTLSRTPWRKRAWNNGNSYRHHSSPDHHARYLRQSTCGTPATHLRRACVSPPTTAPAPPTSSQP
jgi:hypothetical protein